MFEDARVQLAAGSSVSCEPVNGGDQPPMFRSHLFRDSPTCIRCGVSKRAAAQAKARAKSGRADKTGTMHFALIKGADFDARPGARVDALVAAKRLLEVGFWPLWKILLVALLSLPAIASASI
jgi:hypothetical protein